MGKKCWLISAGFGIAVCSTFPQDKTKWNNTKNSNLVTKTIQMRLSYQQLFSALPLTGELVNPADSYSWNPLCILLLFFVHCFLLSPRSIVLSHLRALCFLIYLQQIAPFLCNPSTVCWKFSTLVNKSSQIAADTLSKGLQQTYCGFRLGQIQLHRPKEE